MPEPAAGTGGASGGRTRVDRRRETTPRRLREAARVVFERDGFHNARLSDISTEAQVGSGTLYNYYRSKHDLLYELMKGISAELTGIAADHISAQQDPVHRVREVNRVYIKAFRRNARVLQAVYQARDEDERLKAQWDEVADHFQSRVTRAIADWQKAGMAYSDLDPRHTAHALTLMVERVVMAWSYEGVEYDAEVLIDTLDKIWIRSLGLTSPAKFHAGTTARPAAE
ncbi:DNA-binding transcriptional regulator, AcrR family [Thermomonospora echinospora]|uniref:DNA-binding transcriptional regulator, AcrR family n=1 Tax=Thermomonospora echinospora TaxID=1992 RepID=A0A1H6E1X3_9ACTN|nr:TetR/AcrR family transcriptional regulator [Thermomonospora echinospora]SEG91658.1 DNA-binding transcriptional regulator, AcrR family [Thermomonospora echinospora]